MIGLLPSILAISAFFLASFSGTADFHMTTANCLYNAEDKSLVIDLEVYSSNIAELIKVNTGETIDLEKAKDQNLAEDFLNDYLELNFLFIQDGKLLRHNFLKLEVVDEKTHLVLEAEVPKPGNLMLKNTLFFELFSDQINLV